MITCSVAGSEVTCAVAASITGSEFTCAGAAALIAGATSGSGSGFSTVVVVAASAAGGGRALLLVDKGRKAFPMSCVNSMLRLSIETVSLLINGDT